MAALIALAIGTPAVQAQGGIKSQVIWSDSSVPKNEVANVDKDKAHCLSKGDILKDELIVDPKTKGIKNVVFWLVDAKDPLKGFPTPAALKGKSIDIDQPCCVFIKRHTVVLEGQNLVVKNSSPISHNVNITGGADGPTLNITIPPGKDLKVGEVKPRAFPIIPYSCTIHPWMKGYVLALNTPYYAITDAEGKFEIKNVPAGNYRLVGWHERIGWIFPGAKMENRNTPVKIDSGKTLELKPLMRKVEDDDDE
jgi:hypothetical protein